MCERGADLAIAPIGRVYKIAARDDYLNVCFILARMSSVGNRGCPIDTPAEPGGTPALLALKCLAALAAHTLFKNKGVAVNRFCCLIMTSIVTYFKKLLQRREWRENLYWQFCC